MFQALSNETQFLLGTAVKAGAVGLALATFALPTRMRESMAPFLIFVGSISTSFFLLSAIINLLNFYFSSELMLMQYLYCVSILLFSSGMCLLIVPVLYLVYKISRIGFHGDSE